MDVQARQEAFLDIDRRYHLNVDYSPKELFTYLELLYKVCPQVRKLTFTEEDSLEDVLKAVSKATRQKYFLNGNGELVGFFTSGYLSQRVFALPLKPLVKLSYAYPGLGGYIWNEYMDHPGFCLSQFEWFEDEMCMAMEEEWGEYDVSWDMAMWKNMFMKLKNHPNDITHVPQEILNALGVVFDYEFPVTFVCLMEDQFPYDMDMEDEWVNIGINESTWREKFVMHTYSEGDYILEQSLQHIDMHIHNGDIHTEASGFVVYDKDGKPVDDNLREIREHQRFVMQFDDAEQYLNNESKTHNFKESYDRFCAYQKTRRFLNGLR